MIPKLPQQVTFSVQNICGDDTSSALRTQDPITIEQRLDIVAQFEVGLRRYSKVETLWPGGKSVFWKAAKAKRNFPQA